MQLSYLLRGLCVALCGAGALQLAFEWAGSVPAFFLLRRVEPGYAREVERLLFWLALATRLAPWLLALGFLLPAYVRGEDNLAAERVGFAGVLLATGLLCWWALSIARLCLAMWQLRRCCGSCPEVGRGPGDVPVLLYPGKQSFMAIAGLFSARILISQPLLDADRFSAAAVQVAFAHEGAHARRRDNLKAVLLALLPHVPLPAKHISSLAQQWRFAAEMAADEEGTQGNPEQSLLLAELLLSLAQESRQRLPEGLTALCSEGEHLRIRVERLLQQLETPPCSQNAGTPKPLVVATAVFALTSLGFGYGCLVLGHRAAELLFRIG